MTAQTSQKDAYVHENECPAHWAVLLLWLAFFMALVPIENDFLSFSTQACLDCHSTWTRMWTSQRDTIYLLLFIPQFLAQRIH